MIKSLTLHLTKSKQTCNKMDIWISKQSSYCVGSAAQDSSSLDMSGATARGDVSIAGSGDYPTYAAHWQRCPTSRVVSAFENPGFFLFG